MNDINDEENEMNTDEEEEVNDDIGWQQVPVNNRTKRRLSSPEVLSRNVRPNNTEEVNSSNRFITLMTNDREDLDAQNVISEENLPKPPPIIIPDVTSINGMLKTIKTVLLNEEFYYKALQDGQIRVSTKTVQGYRSLVSHLKMKNIKFHTYQLKQDKAFRVVIKNLHFSTPTVDIKTEIEKLDHKVRNVTNVRSRITKQPLSMFFVDLEPSGNNKDIYSLRHINNNIVQVEQPRSRNEIVQCQRCQQFGHTKGYCNKSFRCVKCGSGHMTAECKKNKNDLPRCANCNQNHPASYRGCEVYRVLKQQKSTLVRRQNMQTNNDNNNNNYMNNINNNNTNDYSNRNETRNRFTNSNNCNNQTYSSVLQGNCTENNNEDKFQKIEKLLAQQIELTNNLFNMITILLNKLCNIN